MRIQSMITQDEYNSVNVLTASPYYCYKKCIRKRNKNLYFIGDYKGLTSSHSSCWYEALNCKKYFFDCEISKILNCTAHIVHIIVHI